MGIAESSGTVAPQQPQNKHVDVPAQYKDPITKKIMKEPVMVLSSMKVYENTSIRKWMESKRGFDPLTGIPMAVHKWPVLLEPRPDIKQRITDFLTKHPSFRCNVFKEKDKSIDWESLFTLFHTKATHKYQKIADDQSALRHKAKQIFKRSNSNDTDSDETKIVYDESVILRSDIPVVCVMGPARNGKSTIVNDILTVKNACAISAKPNVSCTKGACIAKFEPKSQLSHDQLVDAVNVFQVDICCNEEKKSDDVVTQDEDGFYFLDMEGLSIGVTKFTKRLFYACYATSNVVIWNDKEVGSDRFFNFMNELKDEMKAVAASSSKPAFLFLKRDAGDYCYEPYDSLDTYINKDATFEWLRKMNIFASLSGYELRRPSYDKSYKGAAKLNFHSKKENAQLLKPLIDKLLLLSKTSTRFCSNMYILKRQMQHINRKTALSITNQLIANNTILTWFWIAPKGDIRRRRDMMYVACKFDWNHHELRAKFSKEIDKLRQLLRHSTENSDRIIKKLLETEQEIYERVKNKNDKAETVLALSGAIGGSAACVGGLIYGILVVGTGGAALAISAGSLFMIGGIGGAMVGAVATETYGWMTGHYINYSLGRTDEEIKLDQQGATSKTAFSFWELDVEEDDSDSDYWFP